MENGEDRDHPSLQNLPNGVLLSWGKIKQSKRGPKGELSIPQIVEAAMAIADKDGLGAVSMSRVAQSLGFTTMSLYRYVNSKEDLLILMQDAACDIPIPPERPDSEWREEMRDFVHASVKVMRDRPWFADIPIMSVPLTPNNLRIVDWGLRTMRNLPLGEYEKMSFVLLLSGYARHFGILMRDMDRAVQAGASPESFSGQGYTEALKQLVGPDRYPYLSPIVHSGAYTEENRDDNPIGDDFEFGLDRLLDGIELYIEGKRRMGQE
ncbi:TetR family transcriptional regulator [Cohnella xylanilytica]|uniref:TetR/AcrR family transcriptional regulator n=1 Tax=Cohnella xylanilytica TaxID=557555 RepID=UPI001B089D52|nr:TetR/AcrR family transcriptional regulator [Cohnella xylanilytica]GIO13677.1 TetR family transcriptional regulator [Cohnella xylanilytica]